MTLIFSLCSIILILTDYFFYRIVHFLMCKIDFGSSKELKNFSDVCIVEEARLGIILDHVLKPLLGCAVD